MLSVLDGYPGSLKNRADFTGSAVDISLIQFCFTALVQVSEKTNTGVEL